MILPTPAQLHRLVPDCLWEEPDYKDEQWKYDTMVSLPWDNLSLQPRIVDEKVGTAGVSIANIVRQTSSHSSHIMRVINILYEVGIVVRIARGHRVMLSLKDIIGDCAIRKIIIIAEADSYVFWDDQQTSASQQIVGNSIEIHVHERAQFHYKSKQKLPSDRYALYAITIFAYADSTVTVHAFDQGAIYAKTWVTVYLQGVGANIQMRYGALLTGTQHHSLITAQHHMAAHTLSRCTVKYVQYDSARTMYDGHIIIEKNGMHAEASLQHQALLMHEGARAYARPTLQAKTNEVQCGHGSAIGMLDDEQLWYLQSRGIEKTIAQKILIEAFLYDFFL